MAEDGTGDAAGGADADGAGIEDRVAQLVGHLVDLPHHWPAMFADEGRVRGVRHLESLAIRLAELLESTNAAGMVHPSRRPLAPFLASCRDVVGYWELDTGDRVLHLERCEVDLQHLGWHWERDGSGEEVEEVLDVRLVLAQPTELGASQDVIRVVTVPAPDALPVMVDRTCELAVLAEAVRDALVEGLATASVLVRTATARGRGPAAAVLPDHDPATARVADRLLDLLVGFEHVLARAAAVCGPCGQGPVEAEIERRRAGVFARADRVAVVVRQSLTVGTVEPVGLAILLATGDDAAGPDAVSPTYRLQLDLVAPRRGAGVLEVETPTGVSQRAVLVPHIAELWTDHVESALRRAEVVMPAFRRAAVHEFEDPTAVVDPPVSTQRLVMAHDDIPF